MKRIVHAVLALFLLVAGSGALSGQQGTVQQQTVKERYSPFPTDDLRARRAAEFLGPLLRGDFTAAEAYLTQHAARDYGTREGMIPASDVAAEFAGYTVVGYEQPAEDGNALTVWVRKGADTRGVMIRIGFDPPHRILGIQNARIRLMDGPSRPRRP
ncbi:MAG TPA: hypothetical protein VGV85_08125 [Longimicrobiaceae bacterium]|nr:hypothetical protein [Longimicrobiaceae bacterium]